jgi:hypothetical protein
MKNVVTIFSIAALLSSSVFALKPWKVKYDSIRLDAIVNRLAIDYELDANETIIVLYDLNSNFLMQDEIAVVQEWRRRLSQHEVEERRHFTSDENTLHTSAPFSKMRGTSANITLGEIIKIIASNEQFAWTKSGRAIIADCNDPIEKDGVPILKRRLSRNGKLVGNDLRNKGVHAELKFTTAGDALTSDIGEIYMK